MDLGRRLRQGVNIAGGAFYHYSAFRYKNRLWNPYILCLNEWLYQWQPQSPKLLLVGPSAGYSLNEKYLQKFEQVDCIEPDPLAPIIFKRRFPSLSLNWHEKNYFLTEHSSFDPAGLNQLFEDFKGHAILFCNFLGQAPLLMKNSNEFENVYAYWLKELRQSLEGREWASYHDRYTVKSKGLKVNQKYWSSKDSKGSNLETHLQNGFHHREPLEVIDHLTNQISDWGEHKNMIPWMRVPGQVHLIEAVSH